MNHLYGRYNDSQKVKVITKPAIKLSVLLGITFLVLKLTGVINWSWWIVLAPFYLPIVGVVLIIIVAIIFFKWLNII